MNAQLRRELCFAGTQFCAAGKLGVRHEHDANLRMRTLTVAPHGITPTESSLNNLTSPVRRSFEAEMVL